MPIVNAISSRSNPAWPLKEHPTADTDSTPLSWTTAAARATAVEDGDAAEAGEVPQQALVSSAVLGHAGMSGTVPALTEQESAPSVPYLAQPRRVTFTGQPHEFGRS